ncbi:MAG: tetratricopeptide repeat protein [Spirochaetaceae bacterium]|jgi:tetratricopeptide (TPR) repeat protein|nr:tetratricopeptide repeat protein [Spirochaetaceae bacterium]
MTSSAIFAQINADTAEVELYLTRANQYKMQNDLNSAFNMYNTILTKDPTNVRALNGRGAIYQKRGEYLKAKADFQFALSINPAIGETKHNLESINQQLKSMSGFTEPASGIEYKDAARYLGTTEFTVVGTVVNNNVPENYKPPPTNDVVSLYDRTVAEEISQPSLYDRSIAASPGSPVKASTAYTRTPPPKPQVQLLPSQVQSSPSQLHYTPNHLRQPSDRLPPVTGSVPQLPKNTIQNTVPGTGLQSLRLDAPAGVSGSLSLAQQPAGYYERAILAYTDVILRNPGFSIAYNNRGVAYARLGDYTRALADFTQALVLNPYYYDAQANREQIKSVLTKR